jgi:hypothetical protein
MFSYPRRLLLAAASKRVPSAVGETTTAGVEEIRAGTGDFPIAGFR